MARATWSATIREPEDPHEDVEVILRARFETHEKAVEWLRRAKPYVDEVHAVAPRIKPSEDVEGL